MPENNDYLISDFLEIGPSRKTEMGDFPFRDQEIWFFSQNTQIIHDRFERTVLLDMSAGYCAAKYDGSDDLAVAPVNQTDDPKKDQAVSIAKGFGSVLRSAAKGGAKDG